MHHHPPDEAKQTNNGNADGAEGAEAVTGK